MIVTVKTLQQKTFKVEIEESETVRKLGGVMYVSIAA